MSDLALQLLTNSTYLNAQDKTLWILDTDLDAIKLPQQNNLQFLTARFDLYQQLPAAQTQLSDFDLEQFSEQSFDRIVYRISKEKPLVHHVINKAFSLLSKEGELVLIGHKQEGIKNYLQQLKKISTDTASIKKLQSDIWLGVFKYSEAAAGINLEDKNYPELRLAVADENKQYWSKPGVYGWNKIDQGSQLLIEQLDTCLAQLDITPKHILDLGCGYGYLSVNAAHLGLPIDATDVHTAAVSACQKNFEQQQIQGQVLLDNCAQNNSNKYDIILCNPPFHKGFNTNNQLTDDFLKNAHQCLTAEGVACFVTNLHIPLERKAKTWFNKITQITTNQHFKVFALQQPK